MFVTECFHNKCFKLSTLHSVYISPGCESDMILSVTTIGTCMIGQIINVIWESEIDCLSMPWATVRMAQLLSCWKSTAVLTLGSVETQSEGASRGPKEVDVDELVTVRESVHLGPFQTKIIEGWIKPLLGDTAHVMVTLLKVGEGQLRDYRPLPLGLHVLHAYMHLKNGSGKVSLVVRNMSDSHIFLKKGVPVAQVMSASLVPPTELSLEMEAILGVESGPEPMSVVVRQEKLLEKLNLDGLANWSPGNAVALGFAMAELPEREQVYPMFDTLYTLAKKLEAGCIHTSMLPAQMLIERSTGTTLLWQEEWWPWRRKGWCQLILSLGRTPSQR